MHFCSGGQVLVTRIFVTKVTRVGSKGEGRGSGKDRDKGKRKGGKSDSSKNFENIEVNGESGQAKPEESEARWNYMKENKIFVLVGKNLEKMQS